MDTMRGDRAKLHQILINLLNNACKFTKGGEIIMEISKVRYSSSYWVLFKIKDTGIGFSQDATEHVFNVFEQADSSSTRQFEGTGLGLALCKQYIDLLKGNIEVKSAPNEGSTFTVSLPLVA